MGEAVVCVLLYGREPGISGARDVWVTRKVCSRDWRVGSRSRVLY